MSDSQSWESLLDDSRSKSDLESVITGTGSFARTYEEAEYVCHLHTIPFLHVMDTLDRSKDVKVCHEVDCGIRNCMFVTRSAKNRSAVNWGWYTSDPKDFERNEYIPSNCPCLEYGLKPVCFLQVIRSLGINLGSHIPREIDPRKVMFCAKYTGIFDLSYGGSARDQTGVSGWVHVNSITRLKRVCKTLYWFRRKANLWKLLDESQPFFKIRTAFKQAIHTVNGIITKMILMGPSEMSSYRGIAEFSAEAFEVLFKSYLNEETHEDPIVSLKDYFKMVKSHFHLPTFEQRMQVFKYPRIPGFDRFFDFLERIKDNILKRHGIYDQTESTAWLYRMTTLCQTRNLGYLPEATAVLKRQDYRQRISTEEEQPTKELLKGLMTLVRKAVQDIIPAGVMEDNNHPFTKRATANLDMPLKLTASTYHTVYDGGKLEEARKILVHLRLNRIKVPKRRFSDHQVTEWLEPPDKEGDERRLQTLLFWSSYQVTLNLLTEREPHRYPKSLYVDIGIKSDDLLNVSIIHVSEPAKERNLTKSMAMFAWVLTPAGKILQSYLAELQEHKIGLMGSSHGWSHQQEWGPKGKRNSFIFNPSGDVLPGITTFFQDWKEATDYLSRYKGVALLHAFMTHLSFPDGYRELVCSLLCQPQPVSEVIRRKVIHPGDEILDSPPLLEIVKEDWNGHVRTGFMMGNPITKTILHLCHVAELQFGKELVKARLGKPHFDGSAFMSNQYSVAEPLRKNADLFRAKIQNYSG